MKQSSNSKASSKKRGEKTRSESDVRLKNDILLVLCLLVAVILLLSNFGLCGAFGRIVSSFFFGMIGFIQYVFPVLLFFGFSFFLANKNIPRIRIKLVGAIGLLICICAFLQLIMIGYETDPKLLSYYTDSASDHLGGGLIGGLIVFLIGKALGTLGAYIVIIAGIVVFAILLTQRPLVSYARKRSSEAYRHARERHVEQASLKEENKSRTSQGRTSGAFDLSDLDLRKEAGKKTEAVPFLEKLTFEEPKNQPAYFDLKPEKETIIPEEEDAELKEKETAKPAKSRKNARSSAEESEKAVRSIKKEIEAAPPVAAYKFPPISYLKQGNKGGHNGLSTQVKATALKLQETLNNFGVKATVVDVSSGPTVTRYELQPEQGVKVSRIVNLADDIKLNLAAEDIRIEAPIPGKAAVGIEVPNKTNASVMLGDLIKSEEFVNFKSKLAFAVGKDLAGKTVVADIAKMPHLLIAGATGSGKSVCINSLILSILYKATPEEVKFIMIDPKVVELSVFNNIPHLYIPVVTDPKKASGALNWAVSEMTNRYNLFAEYGVRDIKGYNEKVSRIAPAANEDEEPPAKLPQIVIIIDELADLMMVAPGEVEDAIVRLTQLARAAGIHLIVATQRPSVNVITGLIKANMPSRIALSVASGIDSRVIIDMNGAEKLLGKGDMLFYPQGYQKPARVQGAFVSDEEIEKVVHFLIDQKGDAEYDLSIQESIDSASSQGGSVEHPADERDVYFTDAARFIIEKDKASIGMLQRIFKIGFNRAARIMDQLAEAGVVGPEEGTKPRKILMTMEQLENYLEEN